MTSSASLVPRSVWASAALLALSLHIVGGTLALQALRSNDPDSELGAPAIEISVELLAPKGEAPELPPGPDANASAAAPESVASAKEVAPAVPKDQTLETTDADRQAAPNPPPAVPKKEEDKPTVNAPASTPSVASDAAALPKSPASQDTARSAAPAVGVGDSLERVRASWQKELVAHLNHFKRYPAGERNESAEILIDLMLDEDGRVASASILRSSGMPAFDQAALDMVRRADPVPKPPAAVAQAGLQFALPVIFRPGPVR